MGSNFNANVTAGYAFTEDANGYVQITKDRLNLLGKPTVTVPINEDYIPVVAFDVGAEDANVISVTINVNSINSNAIATRFLLHAWLSDDVAGAETATGPDGAVSWTTGTQLQAITSKKRWTAITSAAGEAALSIAESAAKTWYLNVEIDGRVWTSAAITFA